MFQNFFFLKSGSAVGLPQKLKLPILNEKYVHATVVTFKKKLQAEGKTLSAMCTCFVFDVDRDLHNITMCQKQCLFSFNCKVLQKLMMLSI